MTCLIATGAEVIAADALTQFRALYTSKPVGIDGDVSESGCDQAFIAQTGLGPEMIMGPREDIDNVGFCCCREAEHDVRPSRSRCFSPTPKIADDIIEHLVPNVREPPVIEIVEADLGSVA
ncbi:hypothetical protein C8J31_10226 [Rhizobium sp. PP-CC-2G-626]|nr:hypothetical protein C8J31_10226 [Rhizobium sp. PP-CC-2G-626]